MMGAPSETWREELMGRYPGLFDDETGSRPGYPMVEDGWRGLVETAIGRLADILRDRPGTSLRVDQLKQKYGTLRLYSHGTYASDPETRSRVELVVDLAEARSATTCEKCGREGRLHDQRGWLSTACPEHAIGEVVRRRAGLEDVHVVRALRNGEFLIVSCRRYVRATDSFVNVDPAAIGLDD